MNLICRGEIYHSVKDDFINLIKSFFCNLNKEELINKFEKKFRVFNNSKYCISFPFARTALYFFLKSHKINHGEVIISSIQIKGMIEVIENLNCKPIIVEIEKKTLNFNLVDLEKKINKNTKVVILTYLYGLIPNIEEIKKIIKKKNKKILIVEDFSQCIGGEFKKIKTGNHADVGIYSLSATKVLDTYGGGLLVTNNYKIFIKIKSLTKELKKVKRFFLINKIFVSLIRNILSKKYFFIFIIQIFKLLNLLKFSFYKSFVGKRNFKLNSRILPNVWFSKFTSLQASYGIELLKNVDQINSCLINNSKYIKSKIGERYFCEDTIYAKNVYWQLPFISTKSKFIQNKLIFKNIDVASPSIQFLGDLKNINLPVSKRIYYNCIFIPSYPSLKIDNLLKVIDEFKSCLK